MLSRGGLGNTESRTRLWLERIRARAKPCATGMRTQAAICARSQLSNAAAPDGRVQAGPLLRPHLHADHEVPGRHVVGEHALCFRHNVRLRPGPRSVIDRHVSRFVVRRKLIKNV